MVSEQVMTMLGPSQGTVRWNLKDLYGTCRPAKFQDSMVVAASVKERFV